ncbi:MAG: TrkA family potassium uptake protein [Dehalococcoidales bacterium]|jgi:trk system potassium uptake protein TrkA|nr:TrkA family potassium uptake protein [Dehalococcoidales bacterium]
MRKQVAVIGIGRFGASLAESLSAIGYDVLAIDSDMERVQNIADKVSRAVQGDVRDENFLKGLDVASMNAAVVAIGNSIESSVLCTLLLKNLGVPYVVARAENTSHHVILNKIGADQIVYPEKQMGNRWAHILTLRTATDYIPLSYKYGITQITAPASMINSTVGQAGFGKGDIKDAVNLLMIMRKSQGQETVINNPSDAEIIKLGDVLVTAGPDDKLEDLITASKKSA